MSSPNETAEAIWIVIKRILKWLIILTLVVIVGFFVLIQANKFWEWLTNDRYAENVNISLHVAKPDDCDKDYPYIYIVQNKSDKTIDEVRFSVEVRKIGFSNTINSYTSITESKILKPDESTANCFNADRKYFNGKIKDIDVDLKLTYKNVKFAK
jgi:hypothetical protein